MGKARGDVRPSRRQTPFPQRRYPRLAPAPLRQSGDYLAESGLMVNKHSQQQPEGQTTFGAAPAGVQGLHQRELMLNKHAQQQAERQTTFAPALAAVQSLHQPALMVNKHSQQQSERQTSFAPALAAVQSLHQPALMVNKHSQQQPRGQTWSAEGVEAVQGLQQPFPVLAEEYQTSRLTHQSPDHSGSQWPSFNSFYQVAQDTDLMIRQPYIYTNVEQVRQPTQSMSMGASSLDPSQEFQPSVMGDFRFMPSTVDPAVASTIAPGSINFDVNDRYSDFNFGHPTADEQGTQNAMNTGQAQRFEGVPLNGLPNGNSQPFNGHPTADEQGTLNDANTAQAQQFHGVFFNGSSNGRHLPVNYTQSGHGWFNGYQHPYENNMDQPGHDLTPSGQGDSPPFQHNDFSRANTSGNHLYDLFQDPHHQQSQNHSGLPTETSSSYQTNEDNYIYANNPVGMPPATLHHERPVSEASSVGYQGPFGDDVEKPLAPSPPKDGLPTPQASQSPTKSPPVAIRRITKTPSRAGKKEFFCAREGCDKRVARLSDLDRHDKTQHRRWGTQWKCIWCGPEKADKVYSVKYNLRDHIKRTHPEVDLADDPVLGRKRDRFPKVPVYRKSLGGPPISRETGKVVEGIPFGLDAAV